MPKKLPAAPTKSRELTLAHAAHDLITNSGKNLRVGAPTSATQVADVLVALKNKPRPAPKIVATLRSYATGKITVSALDAKTAELLKTVSNRADANAVKMNRKPKSWPRKNAAILVAIYDERKPRTRKPAAPKPDAPSSDAAAA